MKLSILIAIFFCIIQLRFTSVDGSYLDVPRIHFSGKFRADTNSRNNYNCNFDYDRPPSSADDWNYKGSSEWEFLDTRITAVIDSDGNEVDMSPLLGAELFSNQVQPLAKLVDLDVDFQISTMYGLKLGLRKDNEILFLGDWTPSFIAHNLWFRMKCVLPGEYPAHDANLAGSSTSRITNISQANISSSLLDFTRCSDCTGELSIAMSYNYFSQEAFTIGEVIGTIGVAKSREPLNDGGDRMLENTDPDLTFPPGHRCYKTKNEIRPWILMAPFIIDKIRSKLVVDISNAFPVDIDNKPIDLGELFFGILKEDESVIIFGDEVPYRNWTLINKYGGVIEQHLDSNGMSLLERSQLVIVKYAPENTHTSVHQVAETLPSLKHHHHNVTLLFKELLYYIRPMDHYQSRLEYKGETSSSNVTLMVSKFGIPTSGVTIRIYNANDVLPDKGVIVAKDAAETKTYGLVTFTFEVARKIPEKRKYKGDPCKIGKDIKLGKLNSHYQRDPKDLQITQLPIDGQVYAFYYCADEGTNKACSLPGNRDDTFVLLCPTIVAFLAFSTVSYETPYTWIDHVGPIFHQFHHLHHIMSTILNMKNYTEVTLPYNIELLRASFTKDFTDPNYMPVTRDLSPTKKAMILKWLDKPCYDHECKVAEIPETPVCLSPSKDIAVPSVSYFLPPRCRRPLIAFSENPEDAESYFHHIILDEYSKLTESNEYSKLTESKDNIRPLFGFVGTNMENNVNMGVQVISHYVHQHSIYPDCTLDKVKDQLQIATELEFSTLPLYLTALYSIVQDCNVEAYELIRTIVMQEMLHYAQAANILISIGGKVILDTPKRAPKYPRKGLPGGVLPHLYLILKKFTLEHVYYTFMGIETPAILPKKKFNARYTLHTIGQFYEEINLCLSHLSRTLGDDLFQGNVERQLKWPWKMEKTVGKLYIVTDLKSAKKAIREIIDQGEGAGPLSPDSGIPGQIAHFFKFEEIVCQRRLEISPDGYAYTGPPIPYDAQGVWPMMDNPTKSRVKGNINCTTEARAFHQAYRNFLRVLQEAVDGYPEKINESVALMETLQLHAKKAIWTEYDEVNTCGPVWNYEWD